MEGRPMRAWCAIFQWPKKEEFRVGTVWVRSDAPLHEVEAAAKQTFDAMWGRILPDNTPHPTLKNLVPGQLVFIEEEATT